MQIVKFDLRKMEFCVNCFYQKRKLTNDSKILVNIALELRCSRSTNSLDITRRLARRRPAKHRIKNDRICWTTQTPRDKNRGRRIHNENFGVHLRWTSIFAFRTQESFNESCYGYPLLSCWLESS